MTYALLNVPFLAAAAAVLVVARVRTGRPSGPALAATLGVLLALTAVFDNLMIRAGLVAYDDRQRLGLQVGVAPVEDFAYTLAAVLLLPALWHLLAARPDRRGARRDPGPGGRASSGRSARARS